MCKCKPLLILFLALTITFLSELRGAQGAKPPAEQKAIDACFKKYNIKDVKVFAKMQRKRDPKAACTIGCMGMMLGRGVKKGKNFVPHLANIEQTLKTNTELRNPKKIPAFTSAVMKAVAKESKNKVYKNECELGDQFFVKILHKNIHELRKKFE